MKRESHRKLNECFTLFPQEKEIYQIIFKETILNNKGCVKLSTSQLSRMTGIPRATVQFHLKRLKKRQLITIDKTEKTNIICMNTPYEEIY